MHAKLSSILFGVVQVHFDIAQLVTITTDAIPITISKRCTDSAYRALLITASFRSSLHNPHLLLCQPIKFVNKLLNLAVGGFDLALKAAFLF